MLHSIGKHSICSTIICFCIHTVPHFHLLINGEQLRKHWLTGIFLFESIISSYNKLLPTFYWNEILLYFLVWLWCLEEINSFAEEGLSLNFGNLKVLWTNKEMFLELELRHHIFWLVWTISVLHIWSVLPGMDHTVSWPSAVESLPDSLSTRLNLVSYDEWTFARGHCNIVFSWHLFLSFGLACWLKLWLIVFSCIFLSTLLRLSIISLNYFRIIDFLITFELFFI